MSDLTVFVEQRLAEDTLPAPVQRTKRTVLALSATIRADGRTNDSISWLTSTSAAIKIGEYVSGADPASDAERISDYLKAALARTWADHPEYDEAWKRPRTRAEVIATWTTVATRFNPHTTERRRSMTTRSRRRPTAGPAHTVNPICEAHSTSPIGVRAGGWNHG